jgi:NADPH:quinone reductase-like Zn-dependent oxidoreductase
MSAVESRAIRFYEVGEPLDVLQEEQTQIPDPGEGTIRVTHVVTISNHDEARSQGARVNIDELMAAGGFPSSDFLTDYATLAAAGQFTIPVAKRFPLAEWRAAAELSLSGAPHGKVVLVP